MERLQRVALCHGFLVILIAMLAGFMLMFSLLGGLEIWPGHILAIPTYGSPEGWVRAHSGGTMNGLLVIAVGLSLPKMGLTVKIQKLTAYGFIYVAWSFTAFYWLGNAAGNRALSIGDNPLGASDIYGVLGFLPGLPAVLIVVLLLGIVAKGIWTSSD